MRVAPWTFTERDKLKWQGGHTVLLSLYTFVQIIIQSYNQICQYRGITSQQQKFPQLYEFAEIKAL